MAEKSKNTVPLTGIPPSDVMQLKGSNRICIPAKVLRAVGWPKGKASKLIAELLEDGRVRLHRREDMAHAIEVLAEQLAVEDEGEETQEKLSVLGARYRDLSLDKECRFRLVEAVLLHLSVTPGEYPYLLFRAFDGKVEILSPEEIRKRKQRYREDTTPESD